MLCVSSVLCCASISSISCVYLMRLSNASVLVRPNASISSISSVLCCASPASVPVCAAHITPLRLHSFTPLNMLNVLTPLSVSSCSYRPPKLFERFDPFQIFQAFDSYNYPDNSIVSIPSKCLPPRALQRVKINFFKRREKPERFEVFNSFEVFGVYGEYGEIKGVRRVRGKHSYNTLKDVLFFLSLRFSPSVFVIFEFLNFLNLYIL